MSGFIAMIVFFAVFTICLLTAVKKYEQKRWTEKINNNLCGEFGRKLKEYIYPNSEIYRVYDHAILFYDSNGYERVIGFSQFGYSNIPVGCANIVCEWIENNIVADKNGYIMEPMIHEFELYEEGTPDRIRVRGSLWGFTVDSVAGNPGKWVDHKSLMGYMLYHKSQQYRYSNVPKKLKKW